MPPTKTQAELQQQKNKLANSYHELLEEFSGKDLRRVGNYTLGKLIGKGSFGKVYLAKHDLTNGSKVVLKSSGKDDANLAREIHHHRQFLHPHIARLYEVIVTENLVWLVLEYCPGDELYNYLLKDGALPAEKVQRIFTQLVGAVAYIHHKSCVHRDLKLENVLLDKNENVKLCDFGFTREYEGKANHLQTFCGTVCYSAPEMLRGEKYAGEKVDVWSLGIILYALLTGELPFDEDNDQATKERILKEDPKYSRELPHDAKALIDKILSKRPLLRPSLADILADPFLTDHAPQQQALLKLTQPAPFTTVLEKTTLERMQIAGVDVNRVVQSVLSQRCDPLAGWWALLIEKEERKERRRERKRKEKEKEARMLRRLSGASGRLEMIADTLVEVEEEGASSLGDDLVKGRGRSKRTSTPHILISDLPRLPEGSAIASPESATPPVPIEKDTPRRSTGSPRPPLPPKEYRRRTSSLKVSVPNADSIILTNGVQKRHRLRRHQLPLLNQLASLKHWLMESTKRTRSPANPSPAPSAENVEAQADNAAGRTTPPPPDGHHRNVSQTTNGSHCSPRRSITSDSTPRYGASTTYSHPSFLVLQPRIDTQGHRRRDSLSPSPLTSQTSFRHSSAGLRGRKSTSSSVSSVRSIHHRHTHSKASSASSASIDLVHTPTRRSTRSPQTSVKVLPATPNSNAAFPSHVRVARSSFGSSEGGAAGGGALRFQDNGTGISSPLGPSAGGGGGGGLIFARRKKSPFKGPTLNSAIFTHSVPGGPGTPGLRAREDSGSDRQPGRGRGRSSVLIEEDEEEEDDEIEEVEAFGPVETKRGESVHSITVWDEPRGSSAPDCVSPDGALSVEKDKGEAAEA